MEGSGAGLGDWRVERDTDGYVMKVGRCRKGSLLFYTGGFDLSLHRLAHGDDYDGEDVILA